MCSVYVSDIKGNCTMCMDGISIKAQNQRVYMKWKFNSQFKQCHHCQFEFKFCNLPSPLPPPFCVIWSLNLGRMCSTCIPLHIYIISGCIHVRICVHFHNKTLSLFNISALYSICENQFSLVYLVKYAMLRAPCSILYNAVETNSLKGNTVRHFVDFMVFQSFRAMVKELIC